MAAGVRNWTWSDHGSVFYIFENPNLVDDENSISEVVTDKPVRKGIYNLQGQKLTTMPTTGIVIIDNRKVYIK